MSVELRGNFYKIRYDYNGSRVLVKNKWDKRLGKRFVESIEFKEIQLDRERRDKEKKEIDEHKLSIEHTIFLYLDYLDTTSRASTVRNARARLKRVITFFGSESNVKDCITPKAMTEFRTYLSNCDFSVHTKNLMKSNVKGYITYLADNDYIDYTLANKCISVALKPFVSNEIKEDEEEKNNFWTKDEYDKFVEYVSQDESKERALLMVKIGFWGALRIGELLALTFKDIDKNSCTVSISKSLDMAGKITPTKNKSSTATINLRKEIVKEAFRIKAKYNLSDNDKIACLSRSGFALFLKTNSIKAGINVISPHGLRHSFASFGINKGVMLLAVSKHLRHESPDITLKVYTHLFPSTNADWIDNL